MVPMPYTLRPEQDCIVKVLISTRTIATSFSSVENERNVNIHFLLSLLEGHQLVQVMMQRVKDIFVSDKVKP
jgi:hypothetical protein